MDKLEYAGLCDIWKGNLSRVTEKLINIQIPESVQLILKTLMEHGFEAYAVGGCVRDAVLGRTPNDWDITTSAKPEEVKRLFRKTIDTGIAHGTVTVMLSRTGYEVTTYRIDGEYEDGRHPKNVEFTGNLVEDLKRRDFTINAMAYNHIHGLVDAFDGIGDIRSRRIRCVGNPSDRFNEDALRILRAVRFAAGLDFEIEEETKKAVSLLAGNLRKISRERIQAELEKLLMSDHPDKLKIAYETGVSKVVFPELDRVMALGIGDDIIKLLTAMDKNHYLRWTALLCMSDRKSSACILKELKFDNRTVDVVSRLVEAVKKDIPLTAPAIRRDIYETGEDIYEYYITFMKCFAGCSLSGNHISGKDIRIWEECYQDIINKKQCISMKMMQINGRDLIELGVPRGGKIGEELNWLFYQVLEEPELNDRDKLINIFKIHRSYNNISEENQR
ncbi:MAG: CCA tRNA nucleotidyltransferase [Lachnospiraceae bacterium]|nr:CCA tRNA nucleotidyltransferase [Lachnospiraceae bacterium]